MSEVGATACSQMNGCAKLGSVGIPLGKNLVGAFEPDSLGEKQYGQSGEICITGPTLMLGYIGNEEETKDVLKLHKDGLTWLHTGDLGYVDQDGNIFIEGRLKRIYITEHNGSLSKIFPERIEKTILKNSTVEECCVVCISVEQNQYRPCAFLVLQQNHHGAEKQILEALRDICKKELPEYDQPVDYILIQSLPATSVGKVDYHELEKRVKASRNQ